MNRKTSLLILLSIFCSSAIGAKTKYLPYEIRSKDLKITFVYDKNRKVKERTIETFDKDSELVLTTNEYFDYANDGRLSKFVSKISGGDSSVSYTETLTYNSDSILGDRKMYILDESADTTSIDIPSIYYLNSKGYVDRYNLEMNLEAFVKLEQNISITYNANNEMTSYHLKMVENDNETQSTITSIVKKQTNIFKDVTFDPVTHFYFLTSSLGAYLLQSTTESIYEIGDITKQKLDINYDFNEKGYPKTFTIIANDDAGANDTSVYTVKYQEVK